MFNLEIHPSTTPPAGGAGNYLLLCAVKHSALHDHTGCSRLKSALIWSSATKTFPWRWDQIWGWSWALLTSKWTPINTYCCSEIPYPHRGPPHPLQYGQQVARAIKAISNEWRGLTKEANQTFIIRFFHCYANYVMHKFSISQPI